MLINEITKTVIGSAIEVHRALGPGLLESAYEECLCQELALKNVPFERQRPLPVEYKGLRLDVGYRLDLLVGGMVVVEIKAVEALLPIHEAQLLTYAAGRVGGRPADQLQRPCSQARYPKARAGVEGMTYNPRLDTFVLISAPSASLR